MINRLLTQRNVCATPHRMKHLRRYAIGIAVLVLCAALVAAQSPPELKIVVTGDVPTPLTLNASDLAAMPHERVELNEEDAGIVMYEGVPLQEILKKAGLRGRILAGYVLAHARDGYEVVFSMGELDPDVGGDADSCCRQAGREAALRVSRPRPSGGARGQRRRAIRANAGEIRSSETEKVAK